MNRRFFLAQSVSAALATPMVIIPHVAHANPLLWWVARRVVTGFATRSIRRRVFGATFLAGSGSVAQAGSDVLNGAIRQVIVSRGYDALFDHAYTPQVTTNGTAANSTTIFDYAAPPDGTPFLTQAPDGKPVAAWGNFDGDFELVFSPGVLRMGEHIWFIAEDLDTAEQFEIATPVYVTRKRAEMGSLWYKHRLTLPHGRYVLKAQNHFQRSQSVCPKGSSCFIAASDPFYIDRI